MAEKVGTDAPPPPDRRIEGIGGDGEGKMSQARAYVRPMGGSEAEQLIAMLGNAAHLAGDDPAACVALASLVRATAAQSRATEVLQSGEQDVLLRWAQVRVGEDRGLHVGNLDRVERQPPQVA